MASIELLILGLVVSSLIAYVLTRFKQVIGSIFTIFAVMFVFVSVAAFGFNMGLDTTVHYLPGISFSQSYLGFYFAIIIIFIYLMVSFFHPHFMDKYTYKNTYNMLFLLSLAGVIGAFYTDHFLNLCF